jgi:hypothetical protein
MRRLGEHAMTSTERSRRWRARILADRIAAAFSQVPPWHEREHAEPIIRAWFARGFRYPITSDQWDAVPAADLADPDARALAVRAILEAPRTGPAYGVWGALLDCFQTLRARVVASVSTVVSAVRDAIHPSVIAWALGRPGPSVCATCGAQPTMRYSDGSWGFDCGPHPPIGGTVPQRPTVAPLHRGIVPEYPPDDSPGMRAWRSVGEVLRRYPKA